jgi:hypothetical protein
VKFFVTQTSELYRRVRRIRRKDGDGKTAQSQPKYMETQAD